MSHTGQFWAIAIDEGNEMSHPFTNEDKFRTWLAKLDVAKEALNGGSQRRIAPSDPAGEGDVAKRVE